MQRVTVQVEFRDNLETYSTTDIERAWVILMLVFYVFMSYNISIDRRNP